MRMMHPIPISVSLDLSEPCWVTAWQNLNPEEQWDGPNTHVHTHAHTHTRTHTHPCAYVPKTKHCFSVSHTHAQQYLEVLDRTHCQSHTHISANTHTQTHFHLELLCTRQEVLQSSLLSSLYYSLVLIDITFHTLKLHFLAAPCLTSVRQR